MCGAVAVTAEPKTSHLNICHCGMCRKWNGTGFLAFGSKVTATGPVKTYASSDWAERSFCNECGSALWYRVTEPGAHQGNQYVSAGLFDNAADMTLNSEIYIDRKPAGYAFAGDHHLMTEAEVLALFAPNEGEPQ